MRAVNVKRGQITASLTIGSQVISVMNVRRTMDTAPVIVQDRTFVPLRFISEAFGAEVRWSASEFTAYITDSYITDEVPKDVYKVGDFVIEIEARDNVSTTADNTLNVRKESSLLILEGSTWEGVKAVLTLQILLTGRDVPKQREQVEATLRQKLSAGLADEIMNYQSSVQTRGDTLPNRLFEESYYKIDVSGSGRTITFRIYMNY